MALAALLLCSACGTGLSSRAFSARQAEHRNVPERVDIYQPEPILLVTLLASEAGYRIVKSAKTMGIATRDFELGRDVVVTARDAKRNVVSRVSVFNPRHISTAGTEDRDTTILGRGQVTIAFPSPSRVATIDVEVRSGANASLRQSLSVSDPETR
jgi:hypothetical protein